MQQETVNGITYTKPTVTVLQQTPLLVAELAGRTAYNSFANSEHDVIRKFDPTRVNELDADSSVLLDQLAWVHHHHSVLEHLSLSYHVQGTSRGVLQELVRHRIASYTVQSTRYTMSDVINAFVASMAEDMFDEGVDDGVHPVTGYDWFIDKVLSFDLFVTHVDTYNRIEIQTIYDKLYYQYNNLLVCNKDDVVYKFFKLAVAKSSLPYLTEDHTMDEIYDLLAAGKAKRNVGDAFKHIVTDNWKCDLVVTFNLRSLKNFLKLRNSGAAYFAIRWLAEAVQSATPNKYIDLIVKEYHGNLNMVR